jgi:type IV pilus assembly protein PilY1
MPFDWTNLGSAGLTSYFTAPYITYVSATTGLSQFCSSGSGCLSAAAQSNNTIATGGAAGEALVNFLRGDRTNEGSYYRQRIHVLGDIVSSEARYVQAPLFNYNDTNYSAYKTAKATRSGTVYVGANDGMLHAFDGASGKERWAYIPRIILPDLYRLADKDYKNKHQFFVDASPEVGDICPNAPASTCSSSQWKTILVGGLNRGGKGYYALDITDPASPQLLWEFTDTNLGYTYNNPRITKLKDGTWVVLVSSGYNNADGIGRLYVLNANSGAVIRTISTGVGTAAVPSGLARISAHAVTPMTNNTSTAAYGGDTLGNLWRFDINGDIGAAGYDAHRMASFTDSAGNAQPVTVKPLEATINGKPVVFVGTGRFLGVSDVTNQNIQSFYALTDKLDTTTYGDPRAAGSNFVRQTLTTSSCPTGVPTTLCSPGEQVRTSSNNPVDWTTKNGWFMDFLTSGERASTDPALGLGTLLFTTITPQSATMSACGAAGPDGTGSFVYSLDYLTGGAVSTAFGVVGKNLGNGLVTRPVMIEQSDGTVRALIRSSNGGAGADAGGTDLGGTIVLTPPVKPLPGSGTRRVSWRLLTTQ